MKNLQVNEIKDVLVQIGFDAKSLKSGPTSVFISGKQFFLSTHKDKLIIKECKKIFPKKYVVMLSEFEKS